MKKRIVVYFICGVIGLSSCVTVKEMTGKVTSGLGFKKEKVPERLRSEMTLVENIGQPAQQEKTAVNLRNKVLQEVKVLKQMPGFKVSTVRDGEVIRVSIESSHLFQPNEMTIWNRGLPLLESLLPFVDEPESNILLLAVYTDNTGSEKYLKQLSQARVNALQEWFARKGVEAERMISYAMGGADPREPNISINKRAENRRIDFYLVPSDKMLKDARKGKLK